MDSEREREEEEEGIDVFLKLSSCFYVMWEHLNLMEPAVKTEM